MRHCTCDNSREHEPWCDLAEDFKATPEMESLEAKRIAEKATNDARYAEAAALGCTKLSLYECVTQNPTLSPAEIVELINAGKL